MKKLFILSLLFISFSLSGCGEQTSTSSQEIEYSKLTGTYTFDDSFNKDSLGNDLRIYNKIEDAVNNNLFTSNYYPLNTVNGTKITYSYSQSLKLKRDYTYLYEYTITLTNGEEWGKDFASINVLMNGTFAYTSDDNINYLVDLSNPISGNMELYGFNINGEGSVFNWTLSLVSNFEIDIEYELSLNEEYSYNRFIKGRTVTCIKTEEDRILSDNIFYYDILNDIAPYCDYNF